MDEVGIITDYLQNKAGFEADLIWGNGSDDNLGENLSVTLIATGFGKSSIAGIQGEKPMGKETVTLQMETPVEMKQEPMADTETKTDQELEKDREQVSQPVKSDHEENHDKIHFESNPASDQDLEFEVLYPNTAKERKKSVDNTQMDFSTASEEDLDALENIPAFKRRQLRMNDPRYKKKLSNYTITSDNKLSDRNSYLHNRVD
jgi:cell division protein FtsZ